MLPCGALTCAGASFEKGAGKGALCGLCCCSLLDDHCCWLPGFHAACSCPGWRCGDLSLLQLCLLILFGALSLMGVERVMLLHLLRHSRENVPLTWTVCQFGTMILRVFADLVFVDMYRC